MQYLAHIFAVSSISLVLSGCVAHNNEPKLNIADLNISKNSHMVEHENMKSATSILIKKSEQYDRIATEQKNLSSALLENNTKIRQLNAKDDDLSMKILFLTDEINKLQNEVLSLKSKQKEPIANPISTVVESPQINTPVAPIVKTEPVPNSKVENNKPKRSIKDKDSAKKTSQKCPQDLSKKNVLIAAPVVEDFSTSEGKIIVSKNNVFVRSEPIAEKKYVSNSVNEGDVFTYIAQSRSWYKLKSGKYISKKVVVDLSTVKKGQK